MNKQITKQLTVPLGSLRVTKGNLITNAVNGQYDAIMHGVNCTPSKRDSGIAGQLWDSFPQILKQVVLSSNTVNPFENLGTFVCFKVIKMTTVDILQDLLANVSLPLNKPFKIINAFTQYHGGADFYPSALEVILKDINKGYAGKTVGIPRIGTGIGGHPWMPIEDMLLNFAPDVHWEVVVYQ